MEKPTGTNNILETYYGKDSGLDEELEVSTLFRVESLLNPVYTEALPFVM
jgi:hypothetical protein